MVINNQPATETAAPMLVIKRVFNAPPAMVFKAWAEPEQAVHWYSAAGFTVPICEMDVRPGGKFRICMRSPTGSTCWEQGVFREVVEPERLVSVYTATLNNLPGVELMTTVIFEENKGKTRLTVRQLFFDTTFTRGAQEGLIQALNRLEDYLK